LIYIKEIKKKNIPSEGSAIVDGSACIPGIINFSLS